MKNCTPHLFKKPVCSDYNTFLSDHRDQNQNNWHKPELGVSFQIPTGGNKFEPKQTTCNLPEKKTQPTQPTTSSIAIILPSLSLPAAFTPNAIHDQSTQLKPAITTATVPIETTRLLIPTPMPRPPAPPTPHFQFYLRNTFLKNKRQSKP